MKKLLFIIVIVFMVGCKKDKLQNIGDRIPPTMTYFSFMNTAGVDLLNPENSSAFNFSTFKLFYVVNGVKEEVINTGSNPRNMGLSCSEDLSVCVLGIFLSDINILEIGTTISDTIYKEDNGHVIRYNGEVIWDASKDEYSIPIATIIK